MKIEKNLWWILGIVVAIVFVVILFVTSYNLNQKLLEELEQETRYHESGAAYASGVGMLSLFPYPPSFEMIAVSIITGFVFGVVIGFIVWLIIYLVRKNKQKNKIKENPEPIQPSEPLQPQNP